MISRAVDTAVIGSGAAGLCTAILMAASGRKVAVLEAGPKPMPLMRGFSRRGLHFDIGFHYAGGAEDGGALKAYCELLGISSKLSFVPLRRDCCELFRFYRKSANQAEKAMDIAMPYGHANVAATMEKYFPGEGENVARFLNAVKTACSHSPFISFEGSEPALPGHGQSLATVLDAHNFSETLRAVLAARCMLFGSAPALASFSDYSLVASGLFDSACSIAGGGMAICEALTTRASEMGIEIFCSNAVVGIASEFRSGQRGRHVLQGLRMNDGSFLPCEECIYTGHPRNLSSLLDPGTMSPSFAAHIANMAETPEAFMLFGGVRGNFLDGRVIYLCDEAERNKMGEGQNFASGNIYMSGLEPCRADGLRPGIICAPLPKNWQVAAKADYNGWKNKFAASLASRVRKLCPEIEEFTPLEAASPRTMAAWIHGGSGSIYGLQRRHGELPLFAHTRVRGLALAGQSVILPGLLGVMVSAVAAAGIFLGYNSLFDELRRCANIK